MKKIKEEIPYVLTQIVLTLFFIFYFYSVYRHNTNSATNISLLILFLFCGFSKSQFENKALVFLSKLNAVFFLIWVLAVIIQLF